MVMRIESFKRTAHSSVCAVISCVCNDRFFFVLSLSIYLSTQSILIVSANFFTAKKKGNQAKKTKTKLKINRDIVA